MVTIPPIDPADADTETAERLAAVRQRFGRVPNYFSVLANAPAALAAYLDMQTALKQGSLDPAVREAIALFAAGRNGCAYCAAVHDRAAAGMKVAETERRAQLAGGSGDARIRAVLDFCAQLLDTGGHPPTEALETMSAAGFGTEEILEVVGVLAMNLFSNFVNGVAGTPVDFPEVALPAPAGGSGR